VDVCRYLALGAGLGLAAGSSPGPLLTLTMTATLERGLGAGLRVALAPLLTDAPLVALCVVVLGQLPPSVIVTLTLAGGFLVLGLGVRTLTTASSPSSAVDSAASAGDLWRGALVNVLSPHPWLFWIGVGGPHLVQGWRIDPLAGVGLLAGFYGLLIGVKVVVAVIVARTRRRLGTEGLRRARIGGGLLLVGLGLLLLADGILAATGSER